RSLSPGANAAVFGLSVAELGDNAVVPVEQAHLAVQIRAEQEVAALVEMTRTAEASIIGDRALVVAVERQDLQAMIAAVSDNEAGLGPAGVDPLAVRGVKRAVVRPVRSDLAQEFSVSRVMKQAERPVAVADVEAAVGGEGDV